MSFFAATHRPLRCPPVLALAIACISFIAISPKWTLPLFAWLGPAFLLRALRDMPLWRGLVLAYITTLIAGLIAYLHVFPFPLPVAITVAVVANAMTLVPYVLDRVCYKRINGFAGTLLLPAALILIEYLQAQGPSGTWGNMVNSQYAFLPLMQFTSVTGIWGVSFLLYWFATTANYIYERWQAKERFAFGASLYGNALLLVLLFGILRLATSPEPEQTVTVAAITTENLVVAEAQYEAAFNKPIHLPPDGAQADPIFAEVAQATLAFFAAPDALQFQPVYAAFDQVLAEMFTLSEQAVAEGAEIIVWSEAIATNVKANEAAYLEQAQTFARTHRVYFFFPVGMFHPEKVDSGGPFLENKVITIDPEGRILNEYYKNVPVPDLEPSVPGDGIIPVFDTTWGKLSPLICYDADFPGMLRQLGQNDVDLVAVPSGDWAAIAPAHSYMAAIRGIENGTAMVRATGHGTHLITDAYGRIIAEDDYFADDDHLLIADVPLIPVTTLYPRLGNVVPLICGILTLGLLLYGGATWRYQVYLRNQA